MNAGSPDVLPWQRLRFVTRKRPRIDPLSNTTGSYTTYDWRYEKEVTRYDYYTTRGGCFAVGPDEATCAYRCEAYNVGFRVARTCVP